MHTEKTLTRGIIETLEEWEFVAEFEFPLSHKVYLLKSKKQPKVGILLDDSDRGTQRKVYIGDYYVPRLIVTATCVCFSCGRDNEELIESISNAAREAEISQVITRRGRPIGEFEFIEDPGESILRNLGWEYYEYTFYFRAVVR